MKEGFAMLDMRGGGIYEKDEKMDQHSGNFGHPGSCSDDSLGWLGADGRELLLLTGGWESCSKHYYAGRISGRSGWSIGGRTLDVRYK